MSMYIPPPAEFGTIITSVADGTQPSMTGTYGTTVAAGTSNAYGSYATVLSGATLTSDAYAIEVIISSANPPSAIDRGTLVTLGFDPAGGTSFTGLGGVTGNEISHLLVSGCVQYWTAASTGGAGVRFYFPVFVKAGTSIGAKAQLSEGTTRNIYVAVKCYCNPSRPVRAGSFVRTYGATTASSDGTAITQGGASEGAWTSLGTTSDNIWYIETGLGARSAAMADALSYSDVAIGDGSNKRVVLQDLYYISTTAEYGQKYGKSSVYVNAPSGVTFYGRSQASAAQGTFSMAVYGVGG